MGQSKFWFEIRVLVAEISGRSRGAVKLHNIRRQSNEGGDHRMVTY
jgi:hypothetical protein